MNDTYNVPGLEKGLMVLEYLIDNPQGVILQQITTALPVNNTTAFRILATLTRSGYVDYNEREKSYRPSRKILRLGYQSLGEFDLMENVLPVLRSLRDRVKESVFFGILGDEKGIFIEQSSGLHPFKFVLTPGSVFDLHNSAGGKAMLAFADESMRNYYLDKMSFEKCTEHTITTRRDFMAELERVRELGYSVDNEEALQGVYCIGAPVLNFERKVVGAIWVSGPTTRFSADVMSDAVEALLEETRGLSAKLGYL